MTTPTQHLEIFDEKFVDKQLDINGNFAYEQMKDHETQDSWEVKKHLIQTVIDVLEEQLSEINRIRTDIGYCASCIECPCKMKYTDGMRNVHEEVTDSLTTTLSTWQAMLETTP